MTSLREAIAIALSMISRGVTQTGQPGPCTSVSPGGRRDSMPYLTIVCVWPPQISITVQVRVVIRCIISAVFFAASPSRYSSMNLMIHPRPVPPSP